jgi:hypothetical protein
LADEGPVLEEGCDENFGSVAFGAEALGWASQADVNRAFDSDEAGCFCEPDPKLNDGALLSSVDFDPKLNPLEGALGFTADPGNEKLGFEGVAVAVAAGAGAPNENPPDGAGAEAKEMLANGLDGAAAC